MASTKQIQTNVLNILRDKLKNIILYEIDLSLPSSMQYYTDTNNKQLKDANNKIFLVKLSQE